MWTECYNGMKLDRSSNIDEGSQHRSIPSLSTRCRHSLTSTYGKFPSQNCFCLFSSRASDVTCLTSGPFKYNALECFSGIFSSKLARRRSLADFVGVRREPFRCKCTKTGASMGMIHFTSTWMKKGASRARPVPHVTGVETRMRCSKGRRRCWPFISYHLRGYSFGQLAASIQPIVEKDLALKV
jgi:hypothetical protein